MEIIHTHKPVSDSDRAEINFRGDLLIYKNISAMHDLIVLADSILRTELDNVNPTEVQHHFSPEEFFKRTTQAQVQFRTHQNCKDLFFKALSQCGVDLRNTFYDHFPMRIVPFGKAYDGSRNSVIGHHRDTWGANIHSQINWWAPLYELAQERTIAIYPHYWMNPVENDTATWSFEEHLAMRNQQNSEKRSCYPSAPKPQIPIDESDVVKVMLNPGDVMSFSSAHLHASVPNTTDATRYSVEMRTINTDDLAQKREAPNVDNAADKPMYQWFKNVLTKEKLNV